MKEKEPLAPGECEGSTATVAAVNMVVIIVSRLLWNVRNEMKKRDKRKGKIELLRECSRQKHVRILARVECGSPAAFPAVIASPHVKHADQLGASKESTRDLRYVPFIAPRGSVQMDTPSRFTRETVLSTWYSG